MGLVDEVVEGDVVERGGRFCQGKSRHEEPRQR